MKKLFLALILLGGVAGLQALTALEAIKKHGITQKKCGAWTFNPKTKKHTRSCPKGRWVGGNINLGNLGIAVIDNDFFSKTGAQNVNLSGNKIKTVKKKIFWNQGNLYELDLSGNPVSSTSKKAVNEYISSYYKKNSYKPFTVEF